MILTVCANPSVDSFWSFDRLNQQEVNRSKGEAFFPGGKGLHVAFALNELDAEAALLGIWGGQTGKWLQSECQKSNIPVYGPLLEGWSRICITNKSNTSWADTELLGGGPVLHESQAEDFIMNYQRILENKDIDAVVISGSAPQGFSNNLYKKLIHTAQQCEAPVFLDAKKKLLESALEAKPHAVHLNKHEGKALSGHDEPVEIARWLGAYCQIAAVTDGAKGLYMIVGNKRYHAYHTVDTSDVVSAVGSGDCLLAGLCYASLTEDQPSAWARYGVACGSANCVNEKLGMLDKSDIENFLPNVTIEQQSL